MNKFLKLLLGTGLYVLEQSDLSTKARKVRERAGGQIDDLRDLAQQKYEIAADRIANASRAIRGEDSRALGNAMRFAAGVGVGIGVAMLLAPASGEKTRTALTEKAHEFSRKVRSQFSTKDPLATGTEG